MQVRKTKCDQCLFTSKRIVSELRFHDIVRQCLKKDTYVNCHKAGIEGEPQDLCCKGYWDKYKDYFNLGRIIQRLGGPSFWE